MDQQKVDMYLMTHGKYFENHMLPQLRERLLVVDDSKFMMLQSAELKDPMTMLIVSLFGGGFGIDRFMLGETGLGVGKLLTAGGCGIWAVIDWFMIQDATKKKNFEKIQPLLY